MDSQTQNRNTALHWMTKHLQISIMNFQNHREIEMKWENKEITKPCEEDWNIPSLSFSILGINDTLYCQELWDILSSQLWYLRQWQAVRNIKTTHKTINFRRILWHQGPYSLGTIPRALCLFYIIIVDVDRGAEILCDKFHAFVFNWGRKWSVFIVVLRILMRFW